jgi:hypothetical protein
MRRYKRPLRREIEDSTSQGGWLFADSFLALMVIFLATISFVPMLSNSASPDQADGTAGNYKNAFVMVFDNFDGVKLKDQLATFIKSENLPAGTRVLYAEVLGGYDKATEVEYDGNLRGLAFAIKIKQEAIATFKNSTFNVGATPSVKPGQVLLRLTLAKM